MARLLRPLFAGTKGAWLMAVTLQMHSLPAAIATQTAARLLEGTVARTRTENVNLQREQVPVCPGHVAAAVEHGYAPLIPPDLLCSHFSSVHMYCRM